MSEEPILSLMDRTMAGESIYPDRTPVLDFGFCTFAEGTTLTAADVTADVHLSRRFGEGEV